MQIFRGINNIPSNISKCALTIGNFDGVHKGHQKIIQDVVDHAKAKGLKSGLLTFANHPVELFNRDLAKNFMIFNLSQKIKFLKQFDLDYLFILPFNRKIANITADDFLEDILLDKIKMKDLVIGYDFIFGKEKRGNFEFLSEKSLELGFDLTKIDEIADDGEVFSSTKVRNLIKEGNILAANEILGKEFEVEGIVIQGNKNGHKLGFPTSNLKVKPHLIMPKFGVYKSDLIVDDKVYKSVTNFGIRPTIDDDKKPLYETHILDYQGGELYGKKITVKFKDFIRDEKKFESLEELKAQIALDVERAR